MATSPTPIRAKSSAISSGGSTGATSSLDDLLDQSLDLLAKRYAQLPAQLGAEQQTLQALKPFTQSLSDDELDWLAAAGPGGVPPTANPQDPTGRSKNKP